MRKSAQTLKIVSLCNRNRYTLLNSNEIEREKELFFGEQEKTSLLKVKFFLKEIKYTIYEGFKDLKRETQWLWIIGRIKNKEELTGYEIARKQRIITDLLKFIPYSVILLIPVAEVLLPAILWLFPNAIPSFFLFDTKHDEKMKRLEKIQEESHELLLEKLLHLLRNLNMRDDCFLEYCEFNAEFFTIIDHLKEKLNYRDFNSDELILVNQFFGGDLYSGTATINKIVNLFTGTIPRICYKIIRFIYYKALGIKAPKYKDPFFVNENFKILKFNYFPFEFFKRRFLLWQINRKFNKVKKEDLGFYKFGLDDIKGPAIKHFARERGLAALSCYFTLKNVISRDWLKTINDSRFEDHNVKLWYSVMLYNFMKKTNRDEN